ncbi:hypothetical protein AX14_013736 [Amanita brunnescens Koide BX004]|nr:hypothetical protein AX14_013736 [Amanita brunnescens Koide BX004]
MILYVCWLALVAVLVVTAQSNNANCTLPSFDWVFNTKGQSPCVVVEDLATTCDFNGFKLQPLTSGSSYPGPTLGQDNSCHCTSVYYSLISACAACQGERWITWPAYTTNCTSQVYLAVYPAGIPSDTSVPHWAYLDVTATNNTFDPIIASAVGGRESTAPTTASSSHVGPGVIAGAVVGSVVGTIIIVAGILLLLNERQKALQRRGGMHHDMEEEKQLPLGTSPPPLTTSTSPPPTTSTTFYSRDQPPSPLVLYDPDNPSTFPSIQRMYQNGSSRPDLRYPGLAEPS